MTKKEIKINKIEIKLGDKTLELTLEEACKLRDILQDAFPILGDHINKEYIPYPYPVYPYYYQPYQVTYTESSKKRGDVWDTTADYYCMHVSDERLK